MPAAKRISKEAIIDAAEAVLRTGGFEAINARSVAKALGCSTQPIYLTFRNMEELKSALTQRAIEQHTRRVRASLRAHEGCDSRYSSYGMGFVQFAAQEKQLFRWLYLEGGQRTTSRDAIRRTCWSRRSSGPSWTNSAMTRSRPGPFTGI